jgi:uncharacterized membrane protein YqjE
MSAEGSGHTAGGPGGSEAIGPIRGFARTLLSFVATRAQLAANEFEEQWIRLLEIAIWLLAAFFLFAIALALGAVFVLALFWDTHRMLAAALIPLPFAAAGAIAWLFARRRLAERPKFLGATLAEMARDREAVDRK